MAHVPPRTPCTADQAAVVLLGLALDAGVLLALAWLADRVMHACSAWREYAGRCALFGAFAVAAPQAPFDRPWASQIALGEGPAIAAMAKQAQVDGVHAERDGAGNDPAVPLRRYAAMARSPRLAAGAALEAAGRIGSDYECSQVLAGVAASMPPDATLIARYREVARRLPEGLRISVPGYSPAASRLRHRRNRPPSARQGSCGCPGRAD